ncbi:MAG: RagB/SusD family nutrient uptake outer membrane protein [Tannerella sp.]|nr:RagB/SusD family nutrient uptake outer membrane protein [Tannerella sp.]
MKTEKTCPIACLLLATFILQGCNDDYMERLPLTEIGVENFFNTEEDLKMYCFGLYDFPGPDSYTADAGTDSQGTTALVEHKNIMLADNPGSSTVTGGWDWTDLREINLFLDNCDKANVTEDVLNHYKGIARFFRARFYMNKVLRYSDVPWYASAPGTDDEALFGPRHERTTVVDNLFEDYAFAAQAVRAGQPAGAVDRWVVLACMARHALYEGSWRKYHPELGLQASAEKYFRLASDAARRIMDEGGFGIYSTGHPESDYLSLFTSIELAGNPEVILVRQYDRKTISGGFWAYMFGNYESFPTKDMIQSYLMADGSFYSSQPDYRTRLFTEEFVQRDPRLGQTIASPGWELINTMTYATGAGIYIQTFNKNFSGYHLIKGFVNDRSEDVYHSVDYPTLRYAEVLLTYAEAKAELGELTANDLDVSVNLLRARAGMPPMPLDPPVDPVMQAAYPDVAVSAGAQWKSVLEIRRERRVELAFEGFRYNDLMRWHAGKLLEKEPEGIYFPSLGKFDLTGDGAEDIFLIPSAESIPAEDDKETNRLGVKLVYYRAGSIDDQNATVYLTDGHSGNILTIKDMGTFEEPKYYYRPVPRHEMDLNSALAPQLFGWE